MASGYTPTNETANFGKFARIILDLCRDAVFQIVAKEIPPADLPSEVRANLHKLKLSWEQSNKILNIPAGVLPCSSDFDFSALYTLIRNICPGIPNPTRGWGRPPQPNDINVLDDIERIRQKRNGLFGHASTAALSDTEFNKELTEIKSILSRLDKYLSKNFVAGLSAIERSTMDPAMQQIYIQKCLKLLKQDQETRDQLDAFKTQQEQEITLIKDQQIGAHMRQEETTERVLQLEDKQAAAQQTLEETVELVSELHSRQTALQLRQEEDMEIVQELQGKVSDILSEDSQTQANPFQDVDKAKLQNFLHQTYQEEKSPQVSIIPAYDDVPLSEVFTPIKIKDDVETAFSLLTMKSGGSLPTQSGQTPQTDKDIKSYIEMFYKEGELQKNVYLLGKAGSGKTTFCNHLVDLWCPSSTTAHYDNPEIVKEFEYIFFVICRDAEKSHTVRDMILDQLFSSEVGYHSLVKHVLQTKPEKCLVVIDGVDEWAGSPAGLPDRKGLEKCVFLTTSRPSKITALRKDVGGSCRILEIQDLTEESLCRIVEKAVKALNENEVNEEVSSTDFLSAVAKAKLTKITTNPLMLLIVLASWHHDRSSLDISPCVNYAGLMESFLLHAEGRSGRSDARDRLCDLPGFSELKAELVRSKENLPGCFSRLLYCKQYGGLISKVSEFAFDGLFHEMESLVLSDNELGKYLQPLELDVCCRTGILSLSRARSNSRKRLNSVSFFHKTLQEFLAAVWMAGDSFGNCLSVFRKHCTCVADVLDLGVFLVFLCGLSPEKGREVWRYIGELTASDPAVQEYRAEIVDPYKYVSQSLSVPRLQQLLLQCTAEAMHHRPDMSPNCLSQTCNIQDVHVDSGIPAENLGLLLRHASANGIAIKTLVLSHVEPSPEILEAVNRMVNLECLVIQSPKRNDPKQLCEVIFTAVNSLSPVTLLKLTKMSIAAPNRLFTVQLPQALKSLSLWKVSITGRMQMLWPVTMATLNMDNVTLDHGSVLQLATWLQGSSSLQELCIDWLKCRDCGASCQYQLDLTRHTTLRKLKLCYLYAAKVQVTPSNLETVKLGLLYKHGAVGSVVSSLHLAPNLTELKVLVNNCTLSHDDISTLCSVLPKLPQLIKLGLGGIHLDDLGVCVSPNMSRLRNIQLVNVTMSDQAWRRFARSLPPTSHQLTVELWGVNIDADTLDYIAAHFTVTHDADVSLLPPSRRDLDFHRGEQT